MLPGQSPGHHPDGLTGQCSWLVALLPQKAQSPWLELAQRGEQSILSHPDTFHTSSSVVIAPVMSLPSARYSQAMAEVRVLAIFYIPHMCHQILCFFKIWDLILCLWGRCSFLCEAATGPADLFIRDTNKSHNLIINKQRLFCNLNSSPQLLQDPGLSPKLSKCKNTKCASAFGSISVTNLASTSHLKSANYWIGFQRLKSHRTFWAKPNVKCSMIFRKKIISFWLKKFPGVCYSPRRSLQRWTTLTDKNSIKSHFCS